MAWKTKEPKNIVADKCSYQCSAGVDTFISIPKEIVDVMRYLTKKIKIEWQMFFVGEIVIDKDGDEIVMINDYIIPSQTVTGASVTNHICCDKKYVDDNKIVASIHSHGDMGTFFSSTDEETNISDIRFHIVINNDFKYSAIKQVSLPCGMKKQEPIEVWFGNDDEKEIDVKDFSNIKIQTFVPKITTQYKLSDTKEDLFGAYNKHQPRVKSRSHVDHAFNKDEEYLYGHYSGYSY